MMNCEQATAYLLGLGHESLSMKLGLESVTRLARALGSPELRIPAAHIAGTNGKGSTSAMLASILVSAGLRTGLYTSPHLADIRERIRIDGDRISETDFARLATAVRLASEELVASHDLPSVPTFFEQVTMIAFLHFAERDVDIAVLEVGLGGRLDATNICRPRVVGLTRIAKDHQRYLGDSLASIAAEKAGIIKTGVPVVSSPQPDEAMRVIETRSRQSSSPLTVVDPSTYRARREGDGFYSIELSGSSGSNKARLGLRGRHQIDNAVTAIRLVEELSAAGFSITPASIAKGLAQVRWPGRLEMLRAAKGFDVLIDGAHNPDGAASLRRFLDEEFPDRPVTLIFGAMSDKALSEMTRILFPAATVVIATAIRSPRSLRPSEIAEMNEGRPTHEAATSEEAIAIAESVTLPQGLICVAGSLFLVGELRSQLLAEQQWPTSEAL